MASETSAKDAIERNNRLIEFALHSRDPRLVAPLYREESVLYPPQMEAVSGVEAIQSFWRQAIDMGVTGIRIETNEVEWTGDVAVETGKYTLLAEDDLELDQGKYLVVWKEAGGTWTIHRDIWNSSNPARSPQR